jgi:hypothetical protein
MANIFTLENVTEFTEKLNLDELYEKKRQYDLNQLSLFNKILNRIHVRIRLTSRQKMDEQFCWFVVPEVIMGVPKYDQGSCIAYLIDRLKENGFNVRYIHPNTLFISWNHFVPTYVRTELKKKTGIVVNEYGVKIEEGDQNNKMIEANNLNASNLNASNLNASNLNPSNLNAGNLNAGNLNAGNPNNLMFKDQSVNNGNSDKQKKNYTPINSYKPVGNLVYGVDILSSIEEKIA